MKKSIFKIATLILLVGFTTNTFAQTSAEITNASASARLIKAMTLEEDTKLDFGTIVIDGTAGSVTIGTDSDVIAPIGYANVVKSSYGDPSSRGKFSVTGTKNSTYVVSLPESITVTEITGAETMTIDNLTLRFDLDIANSSNNIGTLQTDHKDSFYVGGTLNISGTQEPGRYQGDYTVSVDYN